MKNIILGSILFSQVFYACNTAVEKEDRSLPEKELTALPFEGNWTRTFQLGEGSDSLQYVYYNIYTDSIQYLMKGPLPLNYILVRDTFQLSNRQG